MWPNVFNIVDWFYISIDDFSQNSWIFFMKTKVQVFNWFQEFKSLVEN
jgi:hypothetical protein